MAEQGVRHFGVVLADRAELDAIVDRLRSRGIGWLVEPVEHAHAELDGKFGGKLADPSGNVIEVQALRRPGAAPRLRTGQSTRDW